MYKNKGKKIMEILYEKLVKILKEKEQTISCMESCTGGFFNSQITNVDGASEVLKVGLVTYSNEYKIKFGINSKTIDEFTVYSTEVAREMAKNISIFAASTIGIGITGQIGNENINKVYASIYMKNKFYDYVIETKGINKIEKKKYVTDFIAKELLKLV